MVADTYTFWWKGNPFRKRWGSIKNFSGRR
jgi:hypothetical protein